MKVKLTKKSRERNIQKLEAALGFGYFTLSTFESDYELDYSTVKMSHGRVYKYNQETNQSYYDMKYDKCAERIASIIIAEAQLYTDLINIERDISLFEDHQIIQSLSSEDEEHNKCIKTYYESFGIDGNSIKWRYRKET